LAQLGDRNETERVLRIRDAVLNLLIMPLWSHDVYAYGTKYPQSFFMFYQAFFKFLALFLS
jgi:predicted signal transduction protein with EAL and GGDEF domain